MKKKIYISGKMSGLDKKIYAEHFASNEVRLKGMGFSVANPARFWFVNAFYWLLGYRLTLIYDLWRLSNCDGIYMLNGWMFSNGAAIEKVNAEKMGKVVLYENMSDGTILSLTR